MIIPCSVPLKTNLACEGKAACSDAIRAAFEVDPVLAGEMIFRATDEVWALIGAELRSLAEKWHAPGKVDRAVRFMIASGRPEFGDLLWRLISHANTQVHVSALRAAKRFRPSVLGEDASARIAALPPEIRKNVLHEIASHDPAARCLNFIDKLRDEYGAPESEPRHPDLASERRWPILTPDPDAEDGN